MHLNLLITTLLSPALLSWTNPAASFRLLRHNENAASRDFNGEAFGLEVKHLSPDCRTITFEQSCWEGDIQTPKTKNAYRQVDLCTPLADLLKAPIGDRQSGLVSTNAAGRPMSRRSCFAVRSIRSWQRSARRRQASMACVGSAQHD
jgi:hypothetical protein